MLSRWFRFPPYEAPLLLRWNHSKDQALQVIIPANYFCPQPCLSVASKEQWFYVRAWRTHWKAFRQGSCPSSAMLNKRHETFSFHIKVTTPAPRMMTTDVVNSVQAVSPDSYNSLWQTCFASQLKMVRILC